MRKSTATKQIDCIVNTFFRRRSPTELRLSSVVGAMPCITLNAGPTESSGSRNSSGTIWLVWRIAAGIALLFNSAFSCHGALAANELDRSVKAQAAAPGSLAAYRIGSIPTALRKFAKAEYLEADELRRDKQLAVAQKKCLDVIKLERDQLGPEHPFILLPLKQLSLIYLDQHNDSKLVETLKRMDEMQRTLIGPESPDAADTFDKYLHALGRLGRSGETVGLASQRLDTLTHCTVHGFYARASVLLFLAQHVHSANDARFYARWAAQDALQLDYLDRDGMINFLQDIGDTLVSFNERAVAMNLYGRVTEWRAHRSSTADSRIAKTLGLLYKLQLQAGEVQSCQTTAAWIASI